MKAISVEDRKWQAENDVRTLTEAEEIKEAPSRLKAAKTAARRMVKKEREKVNAMSRVAGSSSGKVTTKKTAPKVKEKSRTKPAMAPGKIDPAAMVKI